MTVYKFAAIDKWVRKTEKRSQLILRQSVQNSIDEASRTAPGKMRGGSVKPGFVPRDTGFLANSLVSQLNGSTALSGENAYIGIILGMDPGDVIQFGWTAAYARKLHYDGWLWVDHAINRWPQHVNDAVVKAKALVK